MIWVQCLNLGPDDNRQLCGSDSVTHAVRVFCISLTDSRYCKQSALGMGWG